MSHKWLPEIRKHQSNSPIILVGTKLDIVEDSKNAKKTIQPHDRLVKKKHVDKVTSTKEFIDYVECSSISQVFENKNSIAYFLYPLRKYPVIPVIYISCELVQKVVVPNGPKRSENHE